MDNLQLPSFFAKNQSKILLFGLLVLVALIYSPIFNNLITNWDDDLYILENPYLRTLSFGNLKNIFTAYYVGNYHPLTLLSLAIDYKLGGIQPWPYQLTNLLLHLSNILLVYVFVKLLLQKLISSSVNYSMIAFITAGLFGIHTFQVESVAWISERKNVLYTFFFLLSLITYIKYLDSKSYRQYTLSIAFFILSLLSKGMAVPLSICIIVLDFVAGRKLLSRKVVLEKVPYMLLSLLFGYIALMAQHSVDAVRVSNGFTLIDRIGIASYGFIQYLIKLCIPYHLSAFYPYPGKSGSFLPYAFYGSVGLAAMLLFILWRFFRQNKIIVFGALFFIANISIVIQLLPVGDSIMSDRYVYIPSIGFFIIIGYICAIVWQKGNAYKNGIIVVLVLYVSVLSVKTYQRVSVWKDSSALWGDAIKNFPENNDRAFLSLGIMAYKAGNYPEALGYYNQVLQMHFTNGKAFGQAYLNMGLVKQAMKDRRGAMKDYNASLAYAKTYDAYYDRALLKIDFENIDAALVDLDSATMLDPFSKGAYINRGAIFFSKGNYKEAAKNFDKVLQIDPQDSHAYLGRGQIKQTTNDVQGAIGDYNKALSIEKTYVGFINRAILKIGLKDFDSALEDLNKASQLDSLPSEIYSNRAIIYNQTGNYTEALRNYNHALQLNPNDSKAYSGRGQTKQALRDTQGAMNDFNKALSLSQSYDYYISRASLKFSIKDYAGALDDLGHASHLDSLGYEAYFDKGYINLQMGNMRNTINELNKAIGINSQDFEAYLDRAIAKYRLADYHGALVDLDVSIRLNNTGGGHYYRGITKIKLGNKTEGCEDLKQAKSLGNADADAEIQKNCY